MPPPKTLRFDKFDGETSTQVRLSDNRLVIVPQGDLSSPRYYEALTMDQMLGLCELLNTGVIFFRRQTIAQMSLELRTSFLSYYQYFAYPMKDLRRMCTQRHLPFAKANNLKLSLAQILRQDDEARPFRILDLPPELRSRIYKFAFTQRPKPIQTTSRPVKLRGSAYLPVGAGSFGEPALTRTNRLIRAESLPVFYRLRLFPLNMTTFRAEYNKGMPSDGSECRLLLQREIDAREKPLWFKEVSNRKMPWITTFVVVIGLGRSPLESAGDMQSLVCLRLELRPTPGISLHYHPDTSDYIAAGMPRYDKQRESSIRRAPESELVSKRECEALLKDHIKYNNYLRCLITKVQIASQ